MPTIDTSRQARAPSSLLEISRGRAFSSHLALSAAVVGGICALIFLIWYPHPYFAAAGAWNPLRVLIGVDLVVGPLLTLIVFKPGKKGLKFDLCVIAAVQFAAFAYGAAIIYAERPSFTVFAVDRFFLLTRDDIGAATAADPQLAARVGTKPLRGPLLAIAERPTDPDAMQRLLDETLLEGKPDIERRPEFWVRYVDRAQEVVARAAPLAQLREQHPEASAEIAGLAASLGMSEDQLAFVPMIARNHDLSVVVARNDGRPLDVLAIDPWPPAASP